MQHPAQDLSRRTYGYCRRLLNISAKETPPPMCDKPERVLDRKSHCITKLNNLVEWVHSKCIDRHIYIDTVVVLAKGHVSHKHKDTLRRLIGDDPIVHQSLCIGYTHIRLHRPNIETIQYIVDNFPTQKISRVDIALDFIVSDTSNAALVSKAIMGALTMKWRRQGNLVEFEETSYYDKKGKRRNIVTYHDRPSKITGEAVAHIEFRRFSASACRSIGLYSLKDILSADMVKAVQRHVKLSKFNWPLVEKYIYEAAGPVVRRYGHSRLLPPRLSNREKAVAWIKSLNARVMRGEEADPLTFDQMKEAYPTQAFIDHQKNREMMPKGFLDALVGIDVYPLLKGAVIVRPMEKAKSVHLEIMRREQEFA
jgi:hypothetical protein